MENYIYSKPYSILDELCDEIIDTCKTIEINDAKLLKTINSEIEDALENVQRITNESNMNEYMLLNNYELLKFEKNKDYKSYSYDFKVLEGNVYSYYEFIFFLNTVEDGGEVEIMGKTKIRAEKGKLLIFPSGWCFPYCHKTPISDDQYLIRGKIFKKF